MVPTAFFKSSVAIQASLQIFTYSNLLIIFRLDAHKLEHIRCCEKASLKVSLNFFFLFFPVIKMTVNHPQTSVSKVNAYGVSDVMQCVKNLTAAARVTEKHGLDP